MSNLKQIFLRRGSDVFSHEDLRRDYPIKEAAPRNFGIMMGMIFLGLAAYSFFKSEHFGWISGVELITSVLFIGFGCLVPKWLAPINRFWMKLGYFLNRFTSPIIMGILFFGFVTPFGILYRLFGTKLLILDWRSEPTPKEAQDRETIASP